MNNNWSSPYKTDTFVNNDNLDENKFNSNENNMININNSKYILLLRYIYQFNSYFNY